MSASDQADKMADMRSDEEWVRTASDHEWAVYLQHLAQYERPCNEASPPQPAEVSPGVYLGGLCEAQAVAGLLKVDPERSSRYRAARADLLVRRGPSLGINNVLCMAPLECEPSWKRFQEDRYRTLDIDAQDAEAYDIFTEDVPRALDFLSACLIDDGRVLVHCFGGRNRSVTVCAAWLMREKRMLLVDVVRHLAKS